MEIDEHLARLRSDGELLARAIEAAGPDANVPMCPEWKVRDLVHHVGGIHRWATGYVKDRRAERVDARLADVVGAWPDDRQLVAWFRDGHARLVETLETADPAVECWSFLPAPSPLAFWARRQAHETAIHRVDAESALGSPTPFDAPFASDGIDEMLFGFAARPRRDIPTTSEQTMALRATDAGRSWLVRIGPDRVESSDGGGEADFDISAPASDLYTLLWNRRGVDGLAVAGDRKVLALWQETIRIRWVE
jgi:uncharacterized protein (TIGR03083 family)